MEKFKKSDITALLAIIGISTGAAANAAPSLKTSNDKGQLFIAEKDGAKKGSEMACGKGSCGKDEKGAEAAKEAHKNADKDAKTAEKATKDAKKAEKSGK